MFRFIRPAIRTPLTPFVLPARRFTVSPIVLKKKQKIAKKETVVEETETSDAPLIDFDDATSKFKQVVDKFTKQANEAKQGKTNPKVFDRLNVHSQDEEVPFTSVAQTSVKGRNFIITLFDPASSKHVINAILGSGLNMNAQVDPSNKYTLKVPLPPVTTETKKESAKQLKELYEKFKHGPRGLSAIRSDVKTKFSKHTKKPSDAEAKLLDDFEKLHKQYTEKLSLVFKTTEQAILK